MHFRKSYICSNELDVQETDFCLTQFNRSGDVISLDAGLRMDGSPAVDLWDLVVEVFQSSPNQTNKAIYPRDIQGNLSANPQSNMRKQIPTKHINLDLDQY